MGIECSRRARRKFRRQRQRPSRSRTPCMLENLSGIKLWDLATPNLYTVHVRLLKGTQTVDQDSRSIGFREAQFTDHGFELNGKVIKLRGLDRHQTFPFVGQAMPGPATAARCGHPAGQAEVQYCAHVALPAIAPFSGCLRRIGTAGAGRNSRLAAYRR